MEQDTKVENLENNEVTLPSKSGTEINYYFICHRKLWLYSHHINMEQESERVTMGRLLHESSYAREKKDIEIDRVRLDFVSSNIIHEVKLTDKMEDAHIWQLLYYLYYLKTKGINNLIGEIDYPKLKQKRTLELTKEKEEELKNLLTKIDEVVKQQTPPKVEQMKICRTCAYQELCWG